MGSSGAGASAFAVYRAGRRRRRWLWLLVVVLGAAAWLLHAAVALLAAGAVSLWLVATRRGDIDRWRRGAVGERATASALARLPARRWRVWHDLRVPGSRANIDHLVVGPTGVWVVDTKSTTAPVTARWRRVCFGDRRLDTTAVRWETEIVEDRLGVRVRSVVAVHGAWLGRHPGRAGGVLVLPADRLVRRLRRGRRRLDPAEVLAVSERVSEVFGRPGG